MPSRCFAVTPNATTRRSTTRRACACASRVAKWWRYGSSCGICSPSTSSGREPAMGVIAVSGSASGIGAAIRAGLPRDGQRVIGIDLRDAEVIADLATADGRAAAIDAVKQHSAGRLDGLVVCAGVGPHVPDQALIVSLNYFGAQAL